MSNTGFIADRTTPIILTVNTSLPESSLAISRAENIIATLTIKNNRPHSQTLFSQISTLLRLAELDIQDISAFAAATGPGSFTGLRVGLAAVKGLADSLDKPCVGIDSLDLFALATGIDGAHLVLIDAGRGEVYCGFREIAAGDIIKRSNNDLVGKPNSVMREMARYLMQPILIIAGDGEVKKEEALDFISQLQIAGEAISRVTRFVFFKRPLTISDALVQRALFLIENKQASPIRPHYIRQSDAEIKWKR